MQHERDMSGLLPIDEACARLAASLWTDYVQAKKAAGNVDRVKQVVLTLLPDDERRLAAREAARDKLDTWLRGCLERGEYKLWACPGSPLEEPRRIPVSAVRAYRLDYEKRIAIGDGPPLYDLQVRLPPAAPVKRRWRKPPPQEAIKTALLKITAAAPTLTGEVLEKELCERLGEGMTRAVARKAIKQWAPQTLRSPGRPRKNKSPK